MKTGSSGINLIKRNEGCELTAYLDAIAAPPVWTIGYGDTKDVAEGLTITQEEADKRLVARLTDEFEPGVMAAIGDAPTTQPQFDAMVSLAWNIGVAGFQRSSIARRHKAGDYRAAADRFRLWNKAGGRVVPALAKRREQERALYLSALPMPAPAPPPPRQFDMADARTLQRRLVDLGYSITVDGRAGPQTCGAALDALRELTPDVVI